MMYLEPAKPLCSTAWLACLLAVSACTSTAPDGSCVSVGSGWRACSGEEAEAQLPKEEPASTAAAPATRTMAPAAIGVIFPEAGAVAARPIGPIRVASAPGVAEASGQSGQGPDQAGARADAAGTQAASGGAAGASGSRLVAAGMLAAFSGSNAAASRSSAGVSAGADAAAVGGATAAAGMSRSQAGAAATGGAAAAGSAATVPNACCHALGVCVSSSALTAKQQAWLVPDTCTGESVLCAPLPVLQDAAFAPKPCRSTLQAEGRCLPDCMSSLASQRDRLPRDICDSHELCAPCFDPVTAGPTGACQLGADSGPKESPQTLPGCCGGEGLCAPSGYVPAGDPAPQAGCYTGLSCVARERLSGPVPPLATCNADLRGPGVCLTSCIAQAISPIVTVQATCPAGKVCFPCELVGGEMTGACNGR